jgi:hypothetical protein
MYGMEIGSGRGYTGVKRQIKRNVLFNGKLYFDTYRMSQNELAPMR